MADPTRSLQQLELSAAGLFTYPNENDSEVRFMPVKTYRLLVAVVGVYFRRLTTSSPVNGVRKWRVAFCMQPFVVD
jgi:hypothetical protein